MCSYLYDENQIKEFIYKDSDEIKYDIEDYFQSIDINWGRCLFLLREFYLIKVDGYSYVNNKRHLYIPSTELPVLQKIIYRLPIKALTNIYEIFYKHSYSYKKVVKDDNLMKKIDEIGEGLKKVPHIMIERRIINERNGLKRYEKWYKG